MENLNKTYLVVYQPSPDLGLNKRRFLISPNQLEKWITRSNATSALLRASKITTDKYRLRYRKFGIIDIYLK